MEDEYPDLDEEYELEHQDEFDLLNEFEESIEPPNIFAKKSRLSLDFGGEDRPSSSSSDTIPAADGVNAKCSKRSRANSNSVEGITVLEPCTKKSRLDVEVIGVKSVIPFKEFGVTSRRFPNWAFVTVSACVGERLYVRLKNKDDIKRDEVIFKKSWTERGLLSEPYFQLKQKAEQNLEKVFTSYNVPTNINVNAEQVIETTDLWVEKFKPKRYLELLSDEGVNRSLLNWIKHWDKIVFKKETRSRVNKKTGSEIEDVRNQPIQKIALLCGPPGLGKTTLAHVVASMAGYNPIEVNASDDRSVDFFHSKLEETTQMQSVFGNSKPNCLILDEIDGAPPNSIDYLLKYVNGKVAEKGKKGKKVGETGVKVVKRPVICICNELYTPSLRALRQESYVIHVPKTSSSKLAQRLLEICKNQDIRTDLSTLTLLTEKAHADIRSCISSLHFLNSSQQEDRVLKIADVARVEIGLKDVQKSLFDAWREILHKPIKKSQMEAGHKGSGSQFEFDYNPLNIERLNNILKIVQVLGDYDKLRQGIYENMLKLRFPRFHESILRGLEWMGFSDLVETKINHDQSYNMIPYLAYPFAAWHFLFATPAWPKLSFPNEGYMNYLKQTKCSQIASDLIKGLQPNSRGNFHKEQLILDVLPFLKTILTPTIRPVNPKLFNECEKSNFNNLLNILIELNITYVQQRSADGSYNYLFDPNFEELSLPTTATKLPEVSYNMKQMISREVALEKLRRTDLQSVVTKSKTETVAEKKNERKTPNHLQKLTPKSVKANSETLSHYKDFFGRIVEIDKSKTKQGQRERNNYVKSKVWFCYKEGYNNAVKKDITIADLLA